MRMIREERKKAEFKECTFTPQINSNVSAALVPSDPIVVRGLGRFMELKDMQRKKREVDFNFRK